MKRRKTRPKRPSFRPTPASVVGDGILLFLALFGASFSFLTAFSAGADAPLVLAGCGACTAVSLLTWSLPRRWWILPLAGTAALWGWGLWKLWDYLVLGEITLRCAVVNTFCTSLSLDGYIQPIAQLPDETWALCAALLVLAALLPLSLLLGLTIQRARSFWLTFWVTLPFPLAPVCISVTPGWLPLMALVLVWCTMGLTSLVRRQDARGAARLTLGALPAVALLLVLLTAAMPQADYQRPRWADTALNDITSWAAHMDIALFQGNGPFGLFGGGGSLSSADGKVDLSSAGPLGFSGRTVLEVETDLRGRIYLRGFSSAVYDGGSWGPLSEETYSQLLWEDDDLDSLASSVYRPSLNGYQPLNFPALADREEFPNKEYAKVTVRNVGADPSYVYVPYQILSQPDELGGAAFVNDSYIARMEDVWTHTVYVQPDCDPMDGAELPREAEEPENNYSSFVRQNYLDVPEESIDAMDLAMQDIFLELYYGTDKPAYQEYLNLVQNGYVIGMDSERTLPLALANVVAAYLEDAAEYNPDTPVTPEGEDFVSWFLTESHEGYCMHFASAATLMLRYLGIPARYVTGYVVDVPASGKVKVPDSAAHAWVEIYLDGYGWVPIEVTPAYAGSNPGQSSTGADTAPTPTATARPTATAAPTASAAPTPTPSQTPGTDLEEGEPLDLRVVVIPLIVVLVILAFPANRAFGRSRREKRFRQENTNRAVIAAYLHLKRLEKWGGQVPEDIFALAKKAKFSPHTLTEEEREQAVSAARTAAAQADKALPWYKKFWCRYILGLC